MYEIWQHRTIVEDWKNNFWIEAASIIGADTVPLYQCIVTYNKQGYSAFCNQIWDSIKA